MPRSSISCKPQVRRTRYLTNWPQLRSTCGIPWQRNPQNSAGKPIITIQDPILIARHARSTPRIRTLLARGDYLRRSCGWSSRRRRGRARGRRRATAAAALRPAGRRRRWWWCRRPRPESRRPLRWPSPASHRSRSRPSRSCFVSCSLLGLREIEFSQSVARGFFFYRPINEYLCSCS